MRFHLKSLAWIGCLAVVSGLCLAASSDLRLIQAVKSQDAESVRALLKQHVDLKARKATGRRHSIGLPTRQSAIADVLIRAGRRSCSNDLVRRRFIWLAGN
jgi:hypothetical protein